MTEAALGKDTAIVTAADGGYFPLLKGLVHSIRDLERSRDVPERTAIKVADIGLTPEQRDELSAHCDILENPPIELPAPRDGEMTPLRAGCAVKIQLRKLFPGYRLYIWIDADAWVQEWGALQLLEIAGRKYGFAAVPEIDRAYKMLYDRESRFYWGLFNWNADCFGREAAEQLKGLPVVNAGILALRADSPIWDAWSRAFQVAYSNAQEFANDQSALNYAIYFDKVRFYALPSLCNWICTQAAPRLDLHTLALTEPLMPYQRLGIVHLTNSPLRGKPVAVPVSDGTTREMQIDYLSVRALRGIA